MQAEATGQTSRPMRRNQDIAQGRHKSADIESANTRAQTTHPSMPKIRHRHPWCGFAKSKDENVRYQTTKDGFIACMRVALKYYGGIT